jgi:poly(A) polymerase
MVGLVVLFSEFSEAEFFDALERMKLSTEQKKIAITAFTYREKLRSFTTADNATLVRFMRLPGYKEALQVLKIECLCGDEPGSEDIVISERISKLDPYPTPVITGRDLIEAGHKPGPIFTTVLHEIETLQLNGVINTKEQALEVTKLIALKDEDIDTSDIPEQKDWSKAIVGKFSKEEE